MMIKPFIAFMLMFPPCLAFSIENPTLPRPEMGFKVSNIVSVKVPGESMLFKLEKKFSTSERSSSANIKPSLDKNKQNSSKKSDDSDDYFCVYVALLLMLFSLCTT